MAGHKILVIDDSKVIRMRVRDMLPEGDFEVLEAKDGLEGINLIRQELPNLIMLDFLLPRLSGWEVFQELQQEDELKSIPLVIMSGRKEEVTDKLTEPFEFFEFIEKPFEKHQLQGAIRSAISKSKLPRVKTTDTSKLTQSGGASSDEVAILRERVNKLEEETAALKRAIGQLVAFVKQKL
ncbi:MAG: response regulator [Thermosynechococcaceae cyanobacterium MS004]|nr:response regulator [Thermosynechococcaceae cyanobacterium MS004]